MTRCAPLLALLVGLTACRAPTSNARTAPTPVAPSAAPSRPAATKPGGSLTRVAPTLEWSRELPVAGTFGLCPSSLAASGDGGVFASGKLFFGELSWGTTRLKNGGFLARLDPRGELIWAVDAAPDEQFDELSLTEGRLLVLGTGTNQSRLRFTYRLDGAVESRLALPGKPSHVRLLGAQSWAATEVDAANQQLIRYYEGERRWERSYQTRLRGPIGAAPDGRLACQGDAAPELGQDPSDRVSVLERATGRLLFEVPLPSGAATDGLVFDQAGRLFIFGSTTASYADFRAGGSPTNDGPAHSFVLIVDRDGALLHSMWASPSDSSRWSRPALSPSGHVFFLSSTSQATVESTLVPEFSLEGEQLVEIALPTGSVRLYDVALRAGAFAFDGPNGLYLALAHYEKRGQGSPTRCELRKLRLAP